MSSAPAPGLCGLLRNPSCEKDGSAEILTLKREFQGSIEAIALLRVRWRDDGSQNVRDNNAAWVAGPSRICFFSSQLSVVSSQLQPFEATGWLYCLFTLKLITY